MILERLLYTVEWIMEFIESNICSCHPETCCHKDYYVVHANGMKTGFMEKAKAEEYLKYIQRMKTKGYIK